MCLRVLGDLCKDRPENYAKAVKEMKTTTGFDKCKDLLNMGVVAKAVKEGKNGTFDVSVSSLVELLVYEWKGGMGGGEKGVLERFKDVGDKVVALDALGAVLHTPVKSKPVKGRKKVSQKAATVKTEGGRGNDNSSLKLKKARVQYRCDSCEQCPIPGDRFSLEGHDVDLCPSCFVQANERLVNEDLEADDLVVGSITARVLTSMKSMKEEDEDQEEDQEAKAATGEGEDGSGSTQGSQDSGGMGITCPVCTYENAPNATMCLMCMSPFVDRAAMAQILMKEDDDDVDDMDVQENTQDSTQGSTLTRTATMGDDEEEERQLKLALEMSMRGVDEDGTRGDGEDDGVAAKKRKREGSSGGEEKKEKKSSAAHPSGPYCGLVGALFDFYLGNVAESFTDDAEIEVFSAKVHLLMSLASTDSKKYMGELVGRIVSCLVASSEGLGKRSHELFQIEEMARLQILLKAATFLMAEIRSVAVESKMGGLSSSNAAANQADIAAAKAALRKSDKIDPKFVCKVHGIPAVRRRCSSGENVERRFYVCGMPRAKRCDYWEWADGLGGGKQNVPTKVVKKSVMLDFAIKDSAAHKAVMDMLVKHEQKLLELMEVMKQYRDGGEGAEGGQGGGGGASMDGVGTELMANKFVGSSTGVNWEGQELMKQGVGRWQGCGSEGTPFEVGDLKNSKRKEEKRGKLTLKPWMSSNKNGKYDLLKDGEEGGAVEIMMHLIRVAIGGDRRGSVWKLFGPKWIDFMCEIVVQEKEKRKGSGKGKGGEKEAGGGREHGGGDSGPGSLEGISYLDAADGLLLALCGSKRHYLKVKDFYVFKNEVGQLRGSARTLFAGGEQVWKRGLQCVEEDGGERENVVLECDFVKCLMVADCIPEFKSSMKDKNDIFRRVKFLEKEVSGSKRVKNWSNYALEREGSGGDGHSPLTYLLCLACIVGDGRVRENLLGLIEKAINPATHVRGSRVDVEEEEEGRWGGGGAEEDDVEEVSPPPTKRKREREEVGEEKPPGWNFGEEGILALVEALVINGGSAEGVALASKIVCVALQREKPVCMERVVEYMFEAVVVERGGQRLLDLLSKVVLFYRGDKIESLRQWALGRLVMELKRGGGRGG